MKRIADWIGYLGLVALAAGVAAPFIRADWYRFRWWLVAAGILLIVGSLIGWVKDAREVVGGRTMRYGANTAVMIVLLLAIVTVVEAVSYRHGARVDLTGNKRYTLSPQTIQLLRNLKTDVKALAFFRPDQPNKKDAERLLSQYAGYAAGRFKWEVVDLDLGPSLARTYGVESYGTIVLETKGRSEKVLEAEEEKLTNSLVKLTRAGKRIVYLLQGHGERELTSSDRAGFSEAKTAMERANYEVKPLILAREGKIPNDAAVVIEAGPKVDLLAPELDALDAFIARGGKLLVMADPVILSPNPNDGLRTYLAKYGFELGNNLVIELNPIGRLFGIGPEIPFVQQYEPHPITRDMGGVSTLFPLTRSVDAVTTKIPGGGAVQPLARTSRDSWGETDRASLQRGEVKPDGADPRGPLSVAAVATKDKARIVVYGTSNLAANQFLNLQGNRDFFLNTVSWLAEEEDQISIRPKESRATPVFLTAQQAQAVFVLPVIVLPGVVALGGIFAFVRRRAAK